MHRVSSNDPHNFDMVLDSDSLGLEITAEVVVRAVEVGRPDGSAAGPGLRRPPDSATTRREPCLPTTGLWTVANEPPALPAPAAPVGSPGQAAVPGEERPSPLGPG
jgi:cytidylate kinase